MDASISDLRSEIFTSATASPHVTEADIHGSIPKWVAGIFIRVGPGKFEWGDSKYNHWFDGDAVVYRFEIGDGKVSFLSRFLRSCSYVAAEREGRIVVSRFATNAVPEPCQNIFARYASHFTAPLQEDNCNDTITMIKGETYVAGDLLSLWQINKKSIEITGSMDVAEKLPGLYFISSVSLSLDFDAQVGLEERRLVSLG